MATANVDDRDDQLRRIDAVTDAALSFLDTESLLSELLHRVQQILGVDTAAILLQDQETRELVAAAAIGLEEEVWQGFRLEVGVGFAGRVAQERAPVVLDQVDSSTVMSPILARKGMATLLGVPMIVSGDLVGVLHVGTLERRDFTERDVSLLQLAADRAALASRAEMSRTDRAATLALQRGLLPTHLPEIDGLDMAARYIPGHQAGVGGDWYDVFRLPSRDVGIVVGDVAGRGLRAAVVMGRLRSALRAYALESDDPADVLTRLDRKIRHFETGSLATVSYAILNPADGQMRISLAGHLPPALATSDQAAWLVSIPADTPVGVGDRQNRRNSTVDLPSDSVCLFFTDGLVERRDEPIDDGFERLCRLVRPGPAETVCAEIVAGMKVAGAQDDIALLAVSRSATD